MRDFQARLRTMLPEQYGEPPTPVKMRSAGLQYGPDGRVAWDAIWRSFCDLAMAGGPPHRGTWLAPAEGEQAEVAAEICRGLTLVTGLYAEPSTAGWVRLYCTSAGMAGWLARAIVMENVSSRCESLSLYLPTGPAYRVETEIRNVITAVAKTCHYWREHMPYEQQQAVSELLREMEAELPMLWPGEWRALPCEDNDAAVRRMRLLCVSNVLVRRQGTVVFVPADPKVDQAVHAVWELDAADSSPASGRECPLSLAQARSDSSRPA